MKITWAIDDGYICGTREWTVDIPDEELEECESEEERQSVIEEYVQDSFNQHISWYITNMETCK